MSGPSQFQQFTTLSPSFTGETVREESPTFPPRDSLARQRLPKGTLWPLTGSPQVVQQDWRRFTDEGAGVQSGASSLAKHGGAYFSAVYGSIQDPIAAPGPYENQEP